MKSKALKTECGRTFGNLFKSMQLMRDEQHRFHMLYRTYQNEYIHSCCDPFAEDDTIRYTLISEEEARHIFLSRIAPAHAKDLFDQPENRHHALCA